MAPRRRIQRRALRCAVYVRVSTDKQGLLVILVTLYFTCWRTRSTNQEAHRGPFSARRGASLTHREGRTWFAFHHESRQSTWERRRRHPCRLYNASQGIRGQMSRVFEQAAIANENSSRYSISSKRFQASRLPSRRMALQASSCCDWGRVFSCSQL